MNHETAVGAAGTRLVWSCEICSSECSPIRTESRCLCGHRLREHSGSAEALKCTVANCRCAEFFYIFAQGAFILKCRCKHKHTDHDPVGKHCSRAGCGCAAFDSPFVCNCDHGWASHRQVAVSINSTSHSSAAVLAPEVNRWDLLKRGKDENENDR